MEVFTEQPTFAQLCKILILKIFFTNLKKQCPLDIAEVINIFLQVSRKVGYNEVTES